MIVQHLEIAGFLGRKRPLELSFHPDLNIVTGYNGAGKTNLLKVIWYTVSGNIYALLNEIEFSWLTLRTNMYSVHINKINHNTCKGTFTDSQGSIYEIEDEADYEEENVIHDARDDFQERLSSVGSSIFFPTFRRIEGGFTITTNQKPGGFLFDAARPKGDLAEAILGVSRKISNQEHTFVTSVSTFDIGELLLRHFNEMSDEANLLQSRMSQDVISKIRDFRRDTAYDSQVRIGEEAVETLESIRTLIEDVDMQRERVMAPMRAVQEVVSKIFRNKGIQVNRRVNFGDTVNAINSDLLSAGEKQMLSFICYNAFIDHSPIFIDEPELSLHVDWQRILVPTLELQKKTNQFIFATHSPFIYGKYPEKEIALVEDRGEGLIANA